MMSLSAMLKGTVRIKVTGANPARFLNLCAEGGIVFWDAVPLDAFTTELSVPYNALTRLEAVAGRSMCALELISKRGVPVLLTRVRRRYTLLAGLVTVLFALLCSSLFIWELEVTGNEKLSAPEILNALEDCGVGIGSYWPGFSIDLVRTEMQLRIPELAFLSVNVFGSRAEVVVRERISKPEIAAEGVPRDLYASETGIVSSLSVLRGTPLVKPGDTVVAGDMIVSREVKDRSGGVREVHAMAEVSARTWREMTAVIPLICEEKSFSGRDSARKSFIFSGKRVKFHLGSGIVDYRCDKIIDEGAVSLEGLFSLPFGFLTERVREYEPVQARLDTEQAYRLAERSLYERLREQTAGGEIVSHSFSRSESNDVLYVTLRAETIQTISAK